MLAKSITTHQLSGKNIQHYIDGGATTTYYTRAQAMPIPTSSIIVCSLSEDFTTGVFQFIANVTTTIASIINTMVAVHIETIDHSFLNSARCTLIAIQCVLPKSELSPQ